jgi:hypothetical protein
MVDPSVELNEFQIQQELRLESGFLACGEYPCNTHTHTHVPSEHHPSPPPAPRASGHTSWHTSWHATAAAPKHHTCSQLGGCPHVRGLSRAHRPGKTAPQLRYRQRLPEWRALPRPPPVRRPASLPACPSTQLACYPISSTSSHLREPQARLPQEVQAECSWLHRRGRRWGSGHTPWHATAAANVPVASPPARWVPAPRPWAVRSPPPEPKVQQRQHLEVQAGIHNGWHHRQSRRCPRHRCSRRRGPGGVPSCSQPANQYTPSAIELARPTQPLLPSLAAS